MAINYADQIDAHVRKKYLPVLVDQIFKGNPVLVKLLAKNQVKFDSGSVIKVPVILGSCTGGSYDASTYTPATPPFDIDPVNIIHSAEFPWRDVYTNITILGDMIDKCEGVEQVLSIVESYMKVARMTIDDLISQMILADGATLPTTDFYGFGHGINTITYGGIDPSTHTAWKSSVHSSYGVITLPGFKELMGEVIYGTDKPDLALTTQAIYDALWAQVQPHQRMLSPQTVLAKVGFSGIEIDGCQILVDRNMPSGTIYLVNTNYWKLIIHKNKAFSWTPKKDIPDADVYVRQILVKGNLVCTSRRMNTKATGVTT